ncbi:hypothetical protein [Terrisporobacter sp.]|uniref:hypothetical protein n=1 Tax=Terrisporobacter sp. TaxID=1965305 RepID=UPI002634A73C|nr:hypothetical protein [Terrisporobacter sp.]
MKIDSYIKVMNEEHANLIASRKGNLIGKILLRKEFSNDIKTLYIENKIVTLNMTYEPNILSRMIFKSKSKSQKIKFIADGSTGSVAYYESAPKLERIDVEEDKIQLSVYDDDLLIEKSKRLARRIVRRHVGGNVYLEIDNIKSIFRPFYVAFYGELKEGNKVRYLPIAADGCNSKRTL